MPKTMNILHSHSATGIAGLALDRVDIRPPTSQDVLIRVRACGLSYPDLLLLEDKYQARPARPFAPGMEVAGKIEALGDGVTGLCVGDRIFASIPHGGMAEYVIAPASACVAIPSAMSFEHGAVFLSSYGTAYHALAQRGALQADESLLVLGAASGVGLSAVQLGKAMGARVIAAASSQEKLALASEHGADEVVLHPREALDAEGAKAFTAELKALVPGGINVICDIVGGEYTQAAVRAVSWQGRVLIVGFPAGIAKLPMNLPLLKGCQIIGVFYGSYIQHDPAGNAANVRALFDLYERGAIVPHISGRYTLEEAASGFAQLAERRAMGKIVITIA